MTGGARLAWICGGLLVILSVVALGSLLVGAAPVAPGMVFDLITGRGPGQGTERTVVLAIRLPRIAAAVLAGAALAVAGAGFQGLTRNPLADPSILGVSGGAAFGVVLGQVSGFGQGIVEALGLTALGFAGALVAGVAVYLIASTAGGLPVHTLLLAGVIVGIFFSAAITVLISIVDTNRLGGVIHWLLGSVAPIPPASLGVFALATTAGLSLVLGQARALNLLALGDEGALELGVDAQRVKRRVFAGAALLTGTVVAFVGPIGFVGLVVPHLLRPWAKYEPQRLLIPSALGGAALVQAADIAVRVLPVRPELMLGVLTALIGAPFFLHLIFTTRRVLR